MDTFTELRIRVQIEAVVTEREAMRWENEIRLQNHQTVAYDEKAFNVLIGTLSNIEDTIRNSR
ncbi:MAG: hypothetical protein HYS23_09620 [Geobacter sp.]|nr:hypothetical protein [Geobacter sp.]